MSKLIRKMSIMMIGMPIEKAIANLEYYDGCTAEIDVTLCDVYNEYMTAFRDYRPIDYEITREARERERLDDE